MGISIGTRNSGIQSITFRNSDGTEAGTISVSRPAKKKTKRLKYNFKEISTQILNTKTSGNARKVLSRAHTKVAMLRQKVKNDEYDSKELESALNHALKLEKVARKRMKHLLQEEKIKQQGKGACLEPEQTEEETDITEKKDVEATEEQLRKLMQEYEESMQEAVKEAGELMENNDLLGEITQAAPEDMSPEDLELLKKKHRAKELKEIMEADLQYLKAMIDRLTKEKQDISSGNINGSGIDSGVSVELSGMETPVQMMEAPAMTEGSSVDIMI